MDAAAERQALIGRRYPPVREGYLPASDRRQPTGWRRPRRSVRWECCPSCTLQRSMPPAASASRCTVSALLRVPWRPSSCFAVGGRVPEGMWFWRLAGRTLLRRRGVGRRLGADGAGASCEGCEWVFGISGRERFLPLARLARAGQLVILRGSRGRARPASVAQSAEQLICNQQVVGSSPSASLMTNDEILVTKQNGDPRRVVGWTFAIRISIMVVERRGGFPEWSKGSDCKSDGNAFEGSNPSPPIANDE